MTRRPEDKLKWVTVGGCTYEITAITTGKVPTLSRIFSKYPVLGALAVVTFIIHLYNHRRLYQDVEVVTWSRTTTR